ncbi:hypothetical protein D1BOALGB6SA_4236 [Olavius sp. associated proteobacterium Delta 1]|nr:hypothetical protein D1BOALGB6SA_4236 [Olavius sp. associated proteobacterium Delta 1]
MIFSINISIAGGLPDDMEESSKLINEYFPNYDLLEYQDLDFFGKDCFEEYRSKYNPGIVNRDFNGDSLNDFAFLLKDVKSNSDDVIFAIFLKQSKDNYKLTINHDLKGYKGIVFILPVEPGKVLKETEAVDTRKPRRKIKLKNAAIELWYCGKTTVVFYWNLELNRFDSI